MTDYYEYFKIQYYAEEAEIRKVLDIFYQKLQRNGGTDEQYRILREAQDTLLNPINRAEYDEKMSAKVPQPAEAAARTAKTDRRVLIALSTLAAVLLVVLVIYLPARLKRAPEPVISPGVYLVSVSTGENEGVLRKFDPGHLFADGGEREGYEILLIGSGEIEWITAEELKSRYSAGGYAPRNMTGN